MESAEAPAHHPDPQSTKKRPSQPTRVFVSSSSSFNRVSRFRVGRAEPVSPPLVRCKSGRFMDLSKGLKEILSFYGWRGRSKESKQERNTARKNDRKRESKKVHCGFVCVGLIIWPCGRVQNWNMKSVDVSVKKKKTQTRTNKKKPFVKNMNPKSLVSHYFVPK